MYIKAMLFAGVACYGTYIWAFSSVITDTKTEQDEQTGAVTVTYKLTGEDAVITADVQTNSAQNKAWASIGPANYTGMTGEVWKKVTADGSVRTISWPTLADGETKPPKFDKHVRVVLTAWSTNAPPDYLVIDLTKEEVPAYYPDEVLLPKGGSVQNRAYKDRYLLMKRIHAAGVVWISGNSEYAKSQTTSGWRLPYDISHPVMLTRDYYIGVYELTAAQHAWITGGDQPTEGPRKPKNWIGHSNLRGTSKGVAFPVFTDGEFDYLKSAEVDSGSVMAQLRGKVDNALLFDLPTWAQWEFAARAGSRSLLPGNLTFSAANVQKFARYEDNVSDGKDCEGLTGGLATVGSYQANAFGLYDMLGNVKEPVLDRQGEVVDVNCVTVDPVGGTSDDKKSTRKHVGSGYNCQRTGTYIGPYWTVTGYGDGASGCRVALTLW